MVPSSEDEFTHEVCWQLLRGVSLGRVSLTVDALPVIVPVEYRLVDAEVAVWFGGYRLDRRSIDNAVVAFAADAIDPAGRTGWSVQVQGTARLSEPRVLADGRTGAGGPTVVIAPFIVTGHRVHLREYQ